MKKPLKIILGLIIAGSLGLNIYLVKEKEVFQQNREGFRVQEVLDGDSFSIPPDQTIRLANIEAPELEFCYGQEAKEGLEELILGKNIKIEKTGRDAFNRLIAFVYLGDQLINETMIENGWAKYTSGGGGDSDLLNLLKGKNQEAKEDKRGVWSEKCYQLENPINPACNIKGNLSKHEHGEKKTYHYPACSEYERTVVELDLGEQWFCSEKEAVKAGFTKSEHCFEDYQKPKPLD